MPAGMRPTLNMTRKAVFDLIGGHDLTDMDFLDLFAGSGAVGLEAISRGAKTVTFVENVPKYAGVIQENLGLFGVKAGGLNQSDYCVIHGDAFAAIKMFAKRNRKFDIIFLDPPYGRGLVKKALKTLMAYDILQPNSICIVEFAPKLERHFCKDADEGVLIGIPPRQRRGITKSEALPDTEGRFFLVKQRKYGKAFLAVYQVQSQENQIK